MSRLAEMLDQHARGQHAVELVRRVLKDLGVVGPHAPRSAGLITASAIGRWKARDYVA